VNAGELYCVEFPSGSGRAQAGRRPAIIVQAATASAKLPTVLVIPLTTQQDALRFPGTLLVEPDRANQLRAVSIALVFQLTAVDKRFLSTRLGTVGPAVMRSTGQPSTRSPSGRK
jgi:mRNA-degrading endonuclease toxin of MazEF toxin-antitoxin module